MDLVFAFLAGAFLTNSIPHIVSGVLGHKHMTPLAKDSTAMVNIAWGYVNLLIGAWFFSQSGRSLASVLSFDNYSLSFLLGSFVLAAIAAWMFSNPDKKWFPWFK
ncbi:MAG: hypothetical protein HY426_02935 [Candidatus Levybacteria bacterium]|nr:hypothetical protein [Candidatus Levybacteria bacterium]